MSAVDKVQRRMKDLLIAGALAPGTRLRQEELARELGVSKIPVREGLQRLAAQGLVRFEDNRGVVVPEIDVDGARELFALRRAVEPLLLRRAVANHDRASLAAAELALTPAVGVSATTANWRFHVALYRAAGWRRGLAAAEMLHAAVSPYVALYVDDLAGLEPSDHEHRAILDACTVRDADSAADHLADHLDRAERTLVDFLDANS